MQIGDFEWDPKTAMMRMTLEYQDDDGQRLCRTRKTNRET